MHGNRRNEASSSKKMLLDYMSDDEKNQEEDYTEVVDQILPKKKSIYKAKKGDQIDEALEQVLNKYNVSMPVIRISDGKYLIGTDSKMVVLKN